jgi:hypothetical protein
MGSAISSVIDSVDTADKNEQKIKEQLELLMKLADARLDTFQGELDQMFLNKDCKQLTSSAIGY